jgi:hypothetical protein
VRGHTLHRTLLAAASVALTVCSTAPSAADEIPAVQEITIPALTLRLPPGELVSFAAIVNEDTVSGRPGAMMYPGPLPVALATLLAQGLYSSHRLAVEKKLRDSQSDGVLAPYQPALSHFTNAELMRRALDGLTTHGDKALIRFSDRAGPGWLIECSPAFLMTQDARALVLQNLIVIHSPDASSPATFKNVVEVVGRPREAAAADAEDTWAIQDGSQLLDASVDLLRESVTLALSDLHGDFAGHAAAYRTVHYPRGGTEMTERAQILRESRQQVVLKTLRGWIMSVPAAAAAEQPDVTASR